MRYHGRIRCLAGCIVMLLIAAVRLCAQTESIGPAVGYEFSVPLFLQRAPGAINTEPTFDGTGTSASHTVQFGVQYINPGLFGFGGLNSRLLLGVTTGWFESDPYIPGVAQDAQFGEARRFEIRGLTGALQLEIGARVPVGSRVSASAGIWTLYRFADRYTRAEYLVSPLLEEEATPNADLDPRIGAVAAAIGPYLSLDLAIPVGQGDVLLAQLGSRVDLVGLRRGLGLSSLTIAPGIALFFGAESRIDTIVPLARVDTVYLPAVGDAVRPTAVREKAAPPTAHIDIFGLADGTPQQGVSIAPTELVRRVFTGVARVIPFEEGRDVPVSGLVRLTAAESAGFGSASLTGHDQHAHACQALNLLGLRLREHPDATVVLAGGRAEGEEKGLGVRRALWLAEYLEEVWGIERRRIRVSSADALNGPMATISGTESLHAPPFATQWRERSGVLPEIGLDRTVDAPAGLERWEIQVSHGARTLARLSNLDASAPTRLDLRFIGDRTSDDALVARLTVFDSLGRRTIAEDRLPLTRSATGETMGDRREVVDVLIPVKSDGQPDENWRTMIGVIRRALRPGARVSIAPLGWQPPGTRRAGSNELATSIGREILEISLAADIPLGRVVIDGHNDDTTIAPSIAVRVESATEE